MPIATDPEARIKFVLSTDKGKEPLPTFIFKNLTARDYSKLADDSDQVGEDPAKCILKMVAVALVGWKNLVGMDGEKIEFSTKAVMELDALLTPFEIKELLDSVMSQGLAVEDKKKFESPSDSGSARSAKAARAKQRVLTRRVKGRK